MMIRSVSPFLALIMLAACSDASQVLAENPDERKDGIDASDVATLSCSNPVSSDDTVGRLQARYGDEAQIAVLAGGEGTEIPGVRLWADDPKRMVEVGFDSEARTTVSFVRVFEGSDWNILDVSTGDSLERLVEANGGPISFYGFEWDYGGTVSDFRTGTFAAVDGCTVTMSLAYNYEAVDLPPTLIGDAEVSSESADVPEGEFFVRELGLRFGQ